jgi:hypothetical protein
MASAMVKKARKVRRSPSKTISPRIFGRVRDDGALDVPNPLTLKWVLPYYFGMTERQAVLAMYALTLPFCVLGLFIPS